MPVPRPAIRFHDEHPTPADFRSEVLDGLRKAVKQISPKFFYDARGSRLFDAICRLPEYYPTRTEIGILKARALEIARLIGGNCLLIELGSGSSHKVRLLLEAVQPALYMPMDISKDHLLASARALAEDYPWLDIHAACIDYSQLSRLPQCLPEARKIAFFPGSSIGNFEPDDAVAFLQNLAPLLRPGGGLLIGVDLKKDAAMLNAAYNDRRGITAEFNLNLLRRVNRELAGDFDLANFRHAAFYNAERGRVEMHLISRRRQKVRVAGEYFEFAAGERIHTENSYKYTIEEFQSLAQRGGFCPTRVWTDARQLFSLHFLTVRDP
jgi:dimethylhistidine N-methyltransferase